MILKAQTSPHKNTLVAIAGPKGGVGKSLITSNLAVMLANMGIRVIGVDLDLGGANLHVMLDAMESERTLYHFVNRDVEKLEDVVGATAIANLSLVSAAGDLPGMANPGFQTKMKIIRHLSRLDADLVLLDLGAGSTLNMLDFFHSGDLQILVTTPEITSVINAYTFLKNDIFRIMERYLKHRHAEAWEVVQICRDPENQYNLKTIPEILEYIRMMDRNVADEVGTLVRRLPVITLFNEVQPAESGEVITAFRNLVGKHLGIRELAVYALPHEPRLPVSVVQRTPFVQDEPGAPFTLAVRKVARVILNMIKRHEQEIPLE